MKKPHKIQCKLWDSCWWMSKRWGGWWWWWRWWWRRWRRWWRHTFAAAPCGDSELTTTAPRAGSCSRDTPRDTWSCGRHRDDRTTARVDLEIASVICHGPRPCLPLRSDWSITFQGCAFIFNNGTPLPFNGHKSIRLQTQHSQQSVRYNYRPDVSLTTEKSIRSTDRRRTSA